jgi:hypothetical protein
MIDPDAAMTYLRFVEARHHAWEMRQLGQPPPWTDEPLVAAYKFTNVFRVLDFGTQFVLTDLLDPELPARDILMRCFLYRHTGRVEAWQYLPIVLGDYPVVADLPDLFEAWSPYRGKLKTKRITKPKETTQTGGHVPGGFQATSGERPIFTSAYLVFPQSQVRGTDKLQSIIDLAIRLFSPDSPEDIMPRFEAAKGQVERFRSMQDAKGVGNFMGLQVLTDFGYSTEDREDEFVIPGPGAIRGALELDPEGKPLDTLMWAVDAVRSMPNCPRLPNGRVPSWMDIQNTICEYSKYARYSRKPLPDKTYQPAHPGPQPAPVLPEFW